MKWINVKSRVKMHWNYGDIRFALSTQTNAVFRYHDIFLKIVSLGSQTDRSVCENRRAAFLTKEMQSDASFKTN